MLFANNVNTRDTERASAQGNTPICVSNKRCCSGCRYGYFCCVQYTTTKRETRVLLRRSFYFQWLCVCVCLCGLWMKPKHTACVPSSLLTGLAGSFWVLHTNTQIAHECSAPYFHTCTNKTRTHIARAHNQRRNNNQSPHNTS